MAQVSPPIDPQEVAYAGSPPVGLKAQCMSSVEVLAQSVSVIAPSTVPAAVLGLIFASAGNATWLSFLLGMLGLVLVSLNINQFARRSASAGSLYSFVVKGLGPVAGILGGLALLFGYMLTGMSTLCGFVITAAGLLTEVGLSVPPLILYASCIICAFFLAARDVQLSAKSMLAFEGAAIAAVMALGIVIWKNTGFALDHEQLMLTGATPSGVLMGVVLVVFGFSGFESSTALGEEAKDPLRTIPRSVIQSVLVSGFVFIFMAYTVILGFRGTTSDLAKTDSPLFLLSGELGVRWLGVFINIGILLSFFSCTLASINATARIIYSMARHGIILRTLGATHPRNKTPYIALAFAAALTLVSAGVPALFGISAFDSQGYFGTLCSLGFLLVYLLVSVAAPAYLKRIGELNKGALVSAFLGAAFTIVPFLGVVGVPGSELFPQPAYPNNLLVWIFVGYMGLGTGWLIILRKLRPQAVDKVFDAHSV